MKKKSLMCVFILGVCLSFIGCDNGNNEQTTLDNQGIVEAEVQTDNSPTISGGKVQITEDVKSKILELTPGLSDYKSSDSITDEMKFKFVYYGYIGGDLSRYNKRQMTSSGITNTWALVPKSEVESKFKETFGVELANYSPKYNKNNPSVYLENGYYYLCTSAPTMEMNYSFVSNNGNTVQIKASYKGDDKHYDEYNITIQPANNTLGFIISGVSIIPK